VLLTTFTELGIEWHPGHVITSVDVAAHELHFADGSTMPYDLLLGVPRHVIPSVVADSGLAVDGWVPVDPATLQTSFADVFAIGDVTSIGTPKAGVFAEGQASVLAEVIAARIGTDVTPRTYDGNGVCYVEFGGRTAARVDVTFASGQAPFGHFDAASELIASEKDDYRQSRVARWIGTE
ncbi:MAG: FAD-dependent oxidoreductase, partial [Lacisediminihabitans sp.]